MTRVSRRRFLEDALLAASAVLAGTAQGDARAEAPAEPRRALGPGDKIRVACIGVRGRGLEHIKSYLNQPDAIVAAVCDVDRNVAGRAARQVEEKTGKAPSVYQDLRRVFDDKTIDAVSLALPIHWHALASVWAMQAGKDVYVEKPVSHNVREGQRMIEAARKYGRICQAGTQSRSHQATRDAIAFIHAGKIGDVTLARGLCYKTRNSIGRFADGPVPGNVDYDLWLGPAPKRPFNKNRFHYNWHWMWDYGSGDLGNQGIHQMDIARWALGKNTLPQSVVCVGGRFGYDDQGETPNTALAVYDYGDARLIFEVRGLKTDALKNAKIGDIVYGTNGYVVFTSNYGTAAAFTNDNQPLATFRGCGNHFRNFLDAVRSRKTADLHAPIEVGHLSSALCHLGNLSFRLGERVPFKETNPLGEDKHNREAFARLVNHLENNGVDVANARYQRGRALQIDASTETIRNDKAADALLTRVYREGFAVPERV